MKSIVVKDNFAFIYFNKSFFDVNSIKETITEYNDFIKTTVTELGKYYIVKCELISKEHTLDKIAREFSNYVLALENKNGL